MSGPLQTLLQWLQQQQAELETLCCVVDTFNKPVKKEITNKNHLLFSF